MAEYKVQLLAVESKLAKDPDNQELLSLKADLEELIELSGDLGEEEEETQKASAKVDSSRTADDGNNKRANSTTTRTSSRTNEPQEESISNSNSNLVDKNNRRVLSESEILARKKEKNRKKKAKLRERIKVQLDIAETEKLTWQSFANKKGLKGVTKKSIFASPCSVTGKVGVGTNGIADAPSAGGGGAAVALTKRKY